MPGEEIMSDTNMLIASSANAIRSSAQTSTSWSEDGKLTFGLFWAFTFVSFARPEDVFPVIGNLHLTMLFGIAAAFFYVRDLARGKVSFRWSAELILVLGLTAWFLLGILFAFYRRGSYELLTEVWVRTLLFFLLMTQTLTNISRVWKIIWAVLASELLACGASILLQGKEGLDVGDRFSGVNQGLLGWNFLGITVAATLPYIACLYVSKRSALYTGILIAVLGSSMWMLLLTASRGGFLGVILSLVLTWLLILRRSRRGKIASLLLPLCLIIGLAKAPDVFWIRLQTLWGGSDAAITEEGAAAAESTKGREILLQQSIEYTLRFPIFGLGVGNFSVYNGAQLRQSDAWYGTHNTYTQLSSEAGIPALALFIALFVVAFRHMKILLSKLAKGRANVELRRLARATIVALASFAFNGFFAHIGYQFLIYYLVGIAAALWAIASQNAAIPKVIGRSTKARSSSAHKFQWSTK